MENKVTKTSTSFFCRRLIFSVFCRSAMGSIEWPVAYSSFEPGAGLFSTSNGLNSKMFYVPNHSFACV
jgi:hypothetical protein